MKRQGNEKRNFHHHQPSASSFQKSGNGTIFDKLNRCLIAIYVLLNYNKTFSVPVTFLADTTQPYISSMKNI